MLQTGYVLGVCVLVLLKVSCVTNTSIEASDNHLVRWSECNSHSHDGSTAGLWTCVFLLSGDPAQDCLETYQVPVTHVIMWKLAALVICAACLVITSSNEPLMYKASYWLHLREGSVCAIKHIKGLPGVHTQGATASRAGRDPSPAASSGSTSSEDGSPTPETQASSESPGSGNSTSSGAGANETMPTDKGVAADVPVSSRKARRGKGGNKKKTMGGGKQGPHLVEVPQPTRPTTRDRLTPKHVLVPAVFEADPSSSEPQLDNGVPALPAAPAVPPSVPAAPDALNVPAAPAGAPSVPATPDALNVPAAPDALNVPAEAGDVAGGGVLSAKEEKRKEKKRVSMANAAAARKAAADLAAAGSITASSAEQPGQAGAFNPAPQFKAAAPAEPAAPAPSELPAPTEPADAGDISGVCGLTARQQRQKEKKRVNREKAAASKAVKKAAADSAAAGSITDNSADQPSQISDAGRSLANSSGNVKATHHSPAHVNSLDLPAAAASQEAPLAAPNSERTAPASGVPQEQDHLLVMGRVPMDSLVSPYVPSKRDSAEQKRAKKQVYESLVELATGQHQIISCWRIAGDGNCGYRATMIGLIEGAHANATFKQSLLASLPKAMEAIRRYCFTEEREGAQTCPINQGYRQLTTLVANKDNLSMDTLLRGVSRTSGQRFRLLLRGQTKAAAKASVSASSAAATYFLW
ncbi:hypothetical protein WJX82_000273 [Trebouxia sp. C0006]